MITKACRKNVGVEAGDKLPAYAWPGGYPLYYICKDGGTLCPDCANGENGSLAAEQDADDDQWTVVAAYINYEETDLGCDHCGKSIESAYGGE